MTQIMKYESKQIFNVNNDTNHEIERKQIFNVNKQGHKS